MSLDLTPGNRFKSALESENPLAIIGVINAYGALLANKTRFKSIYLPGNAVSNSAFGIPDLSVLTLDNITEEAFRITSVTTLPLIVDAGAGFENPALTIKAIEQADAAGMHINDLVGLRKGEANSTAELISTHMMQNRIKACVDHRLDKDFQVIAQTYARNIDGLELTLERIQKYVEAGADLILVEGLMRADEFRKIAKASEVPVMANMAEFTKTPLYTREELGDTGVRAIFYPLTAFRAMNAAAIKVLRNLRLQGSQAGFLDELQSDEEMNEILNFNGPA